jgi:hypothetical protein
MSAWPKFEAFAMIARAPSPVSESAVFADLAFPASEPTWPVLLALAACAGVMLVFTALVVVAVVIAARRKR